MPSLRVKVHLTLIWMVLASHMLTNFQLYQEEWEDHRWDYRVTSDMGLMDWLFVATRAVLWWLWATALGRQGEIDINEFLQYCSGEVGWQHGTLRWQGGAVLHWDKGGTQSGQGIGWRFNHLLGWQSWLSNGWWPVKNLLKEFDQVWRWGLLVVGSKGLGWWVTFWWLDTCEWFFFFFLCVIFFWFWIDGNDASNKSVFALIPKSTQDKQNKTETIIK